MGTVASSLACLGGESAWAQDQLQLQNQLNAFRSIRWQEGPCTAKLRSIGEVKVPAGFKFTDETGTAAMMKVTGNLVNSRDMGLICPVKYDLNPGADSWFLVFVWEDVGFVKDDEKDKLDANAILQSLKDGMANGNQQRAAQGLPRLDIIGWEKSPFYDPATNNLTWGTRIRSAMGGGDTINYNSRILGRSGYVSVEMVIEPNLLQKELPHYTEIIKGYSFQSGQKYSEWREGDKVAAYGLTGLIAGGAVAVAAKSGLLGKLGKFIIYIVCGGAALIGGLFKKLFGRGQTSGA
jgi:uncharacterized membrane-anchored protein